MNTFRLVRALPESLRYRDADVVFEFAEVVVREDTLSVFRARKLPPQSGEVIIHSADSREKLDFQLRDAFPCESYSKQAQIMASLVRKGYAERLDGACDR